MGFVSTYTLKFFLSLESLLTCKISLYLDVIVEIVSIRYYLLVAQHYTRVT